MRWAVPPSVGGVAEWQQRFLGERAALGHWTIENDIK